jgi:hypothetical protein
VVVDAIDEQAKLFYLKYGFVPCEDQLNSLFLPIRKLKMI